MKQEEKAKAYDEAIKKAAALYKASESMSGCNVIIETLFPELAESEDEKVRKALIQLFQSDNEESFGEFTNKQFVAWLEKQAEQKFTWSKEDVHRIKDIAYFLDTAKKHYACTEELDACIDWIQSLKSKVQPKQEWSEEDSYYRNHIIQIIEEINNAPLKRGEDWESYINWLKSLRPQNTYNPYKAVVESIAEMCKHYDKASHSGLRDFYDNVKVKCKDAKEYDKMFPQAQWKPSEEQMRILDLAIRGGINHGTREETTLVSLYEDLKKLNDEQV